jgi:acetyl/propionyl-CoA carboxylase alpha subunit
VTGLDLVRQQLLVAQGTPPEFDDVVLRGAAIEARVYAEDPDSQFLPQSGRLVGWREPEGVRVDSGVAEGDEVSPYFDPMLAKVVAYGASRAEAAQKLARALRDLRVQGVRNNRDFLVGILEHPSFLAGDTTIDFIERVDPPRRREIGSEERQRAVLAAGLADRARAYAARTEHPEPQPQIPPGIPPGWGNPLGGARFGYRFGEDEIQLSYSERGDGQFACKVDDVELTAQVHGWSEPSMDLEVGDVRETVTVTTDSDSGRVWVQGAEGEVALIELPRFPELEAEVPSGSLVAPMNGAVVSVEVAVGDWVDEGQTVLILEAMKMEHRIVAPVAGFVHELRASVDEPVAADSVLAVVDAETPEELSEESVEVVG